MDASAPLPTDAAVKRFNRACRWATLGWLTILIVVSQLVRPTYQDLSGIYMGGLIARLGAWNALYPVPDKRDPFYIGAAGVEKPAFVDLARRYQVRQLTPYLQPPWQAVLFYPMGWFGFQAAHWVWLLLLILSTWVVAWQAGEVLERCSGRSSRAAGVMMLLVATSPLAYRTIRSQNMSAIMGLLIGAICLHFATRDSTRGAVGSALAAALGAVMKMATVILVPVAIALGRWRSILLAVVFGMAFVLLSFAMTGRQTFHEFFTQIAPTLGGSSIGPGNKSLQGLLIRMHGNRPIEPAAMAIFRVFQAGTFLLTLALITFSRRAAGKDWSPPQIFAASASLISWLLIFSPLCWEHYFIYLCPFWGWLAWESMHGFLLKRATAVAAIAIHWATLPPVWHGRILPEPFNSYTLLGLIAMLLLGWMRLGNRRRDALATGTRSREAPVAVHSAG